MHTNKHVILGIVAIMSTAKSVIAIPVAKVDSSLDEPTTLPDITPSPVTAVNDIADLGTEVASLASDTTSLATGLGSLEDTSDLLSRLPVPGLTSLTGTAEDPK